MKNLLFVISLLFTANIFAAESMRHCMLLPITDVNDNKIGFKVFEDIENYIKDSSWCTYKSNSELINILGQYSKNLEGHLNNKDVLKVIADKTKSGSLIRIALVTGEGAVDVKVEVIGENGEDRYFKEQTRLKSVDSTVISQTVKNWLDMYEKTIPYNGRVKGVLGDQFTIDIGKKSQLFNGSEIVIERQTAKRQHPLLKEIIDYQSEKIADARVFDVNENQAQAKVINYEGNKKLKIDDWVRVRSVESRKVIEQVAYGDKVDNEFGKLGSVGIFLNVGGGSITQTGSSERSMDGMMIGGDLEAELWATRNYWFGLDYGKRLGSYKKDVGSFSSESNSTDNSSIRVKAGYKYLPMGFFYGPQIDLYFGYGSYTYGMATNQTDGFTEFTFSGMLLGARGSLPVYQGVRAYMLIDFLLTSKYEEKIRVFGTDESSSNYRLEIGGQYAYETNITLSGGLQILSNKASFKGATKEEQFKDTSVKVGAIFTF
ncbi:MAG: hypothetical protein K2Q18_07115 [Bdellovibrionales bacterium]|nr:hypothetical protein [Bdellovibrionales bacterium]